MEKKAPSIYPSNCFAEPRQRQPEHGADPRPLQLHLEPRDGRLRLHRRQPAAEAQRRRADRLGRVHCDGRQQENAHATLPRVIDPFDHLISFKFQASERNIPDRILLSCQQENFYSGFVMVGKLCPLPE